MTVGIFESPPTCSCAGNLVHYFRRIMIIKVIITLGKFQITVLRPLFQELRQGQECWTV